MDGLELLIAFVVLVPIAILVLSIIALVKSSRAQANLLRVEERYNARLTNIENKLSQLWESQDDQRSATVSENTEPKTQTEEATPPDDDAEDIVDSEAEPTDETKDQTEEPSANDNSEPQLAAARSGPWGSVSGNASKKNFDLESLVGGRWSILLGGITLAFGVVFLVRHSIEAGYLGPGQRVLIGAFFSLLLLAAGEWLRRSDKDFALPVYAKADVPGILTGAGAFGIFATIYSAYALYGFIGPALAFVALTLAGIATMLLSALHGPKLAAIGVLGAYATPMLVSSSNPDTIPLAIHVLIVTAVVLALAHIREWRWLAVCGFVFSTLWVILAASALTNEGIAGLIMLVGLAALFGILFYLREDPALRDQKPEITAILAYGLLTLAFFVQLAVNSELPAIPAALGTALIILGLAIFRTSIAPLALASVVISVLAILENKLGFTIADGLIQTSDLQNNVVPRDTAGFIQNALIIALPPALLALWGTRRIAMDAPRASGWLASAASALSFFGLVAAYLRIAPFETQILMGAISLGIAALLSVVTEFFIKMKPEDKSHPAPAAFAVGAIACAAFAISISLEKGWFPLAFSLTALGITVVYRARPVSTLPWLSVTAMVITGLAIFANMPGEMPKVSSTLIFNELILLLAVPSIALLAAGEVLHRSPDKQASLPSPLLTAAGLALAGLFVGFEITHFVNGGNLTTAKQSLPETAGHAIAALAFAIGLQKLAGRSKNPLFDKASLVAGAVSVLLSGFGLLLAFNPAFNKENLGDGMIFNLLLPAYLITGILAAIVALLSRNKRPRWYTLMYAALSGLLMFTYFSLTLRKGFQGMTVDLNQPTSDLEFWLYSPLWLLLGGILLAIGLRLRSQPIRAASGLLIALTIFKVFMMDMAALEGILRALSFIGLGISLIVIGRFYQRILTRNASVAST